MIQVLERLPDGRSAALRLVVPHHAECLGEVDCVQRCQRRPLPHPVVSNPLRLPQQLLQRLEQAVVRPPMLSGTRSTLSAPLLPVKHG